MPIIVLVLAYPTFVEIDLNEVQDTENCNDEVQTIEYKSCSKRRVSIASEYHYKQLPKAQNSVCGLQFWQSILPPKQITLGLGACVPCAPARGQRYLASIFYWATWTASLLLREHVGM